MTIINRKAKLNFGANSYSDIEYEFGNDPITEDDLKIMLEDYAHCARVLEDNGIDTNRHLVNPTTIKKEVKKQTIPSETPSIPQKPQTAPPQQEQQTYAPKQPTTKSNPYDIKIIKGKENLDKSPAWVKDVIPHECPKCGHDAIFFNTGIAKSTGNPWYSYACANKECKHSEFINKPKPQANPQQNQTPVEDDYSM